MGDGILSVYGLGWDGMVWDGDGLGWLGMGWLGDGMGMGMGFTNM